LLVVGGEVKSTKEEEAPNSRPGLTHLPSTRGPPGSTTSYSALMQALPLPTLLQCRLYHFQLCSNAGSTTSYSACQAHLLPTLLNRLYYFLLCVPAPTTSHSACQGVPLPALITRLCHFLWLTRLY
jgi:hypothetical protein